MRFHFELRTHYLKKKMPQGLINKLTSLRYLRA